MVVPILTGEKVLASEEKDLVRPEIVGILGRLVESQPHDPSKHGEIRFSASVPALEKGQQRGSALFASHHSQ